MFIYSALLNRQQEITSQKMLILFFRIIRREFLSANISILCAKCPKYGIELKTKVCNTTEYLDDLTKKR